MGVNLKSGAPTVNTLVEQVGKGIRPRDKGISGGTRHPASFTREEPVSVPGWLDTSGNSLNSPGNVNMPGRFTRNSLNDEKDDVTTPMGLIREEKREKSNGISGGTWMPGAFTEDEPLDYGRLAEGIGELGRHGVAGALPTLGPGIDELSESGLFGAVPQMVSYGTYGKPLSYDEDVEHDAEDFVARTAGRDEPDNGSTNDPFYGYYGSMSPDVSYTNVSEAANATGSIAGNDERIASMQSGHQGMTDDEWSAHQTRNVGGHTVHPGAKPSDAHHPTNAGVQDFGEPIDDGTSYDYDHVTSQWISGQELQRQQQAGLIDMRYEDIDPLAVYNKIELKYEYGYHPFAPDDTARVKYAQAEAQFLANGVPNGIMQSRRTFGDAVGHDFTISIDGDQISGRDFQDQTVAYLDQIGLDDWGKPPENGEYTMYVSLYRYTDIAGNEIYAFGEPAIDPNSDGMTYTVTFPDGGVSIVDDSQFDKGDYFGSRRLVPVTDPESFNFGSMVEDGQVLYVRNMVLPDGTSLRWDQVMDILGDEDHEGGHVENDNIGLGSDISYDGYDTFLDTPLNGGTEFVSDGRLHVDAGTIPMLYDMFATSAPIMVPAPQNFVWSINQAAEMSPYGIDSFSYNRGNHSYQLTHPVMDSKGNVTSGAEYPELMANYMITAGFPVTEYIAGGIGGGPIKKAVANRWKHSPLKHYGADLGGEAVEEMIGNVPEEYQAYGPRFAFAAEDDRATDLRGRPLRYEETPAIGRFANYWDFDDLANAALGGATMGAVMSAHHLSPRNLLANAIARENDRVNEQAQLHPEYSVEGR